MEEAEAAAEADEVAMVVAEARAALAASAFSVPKVSAQRVKSAATAAAEAAEEATMEEMEPLSGCGGGGGGSESPELVGASAMGVALVRVVRRTNPMVQTRRIQRGIRRRVGVVVKLRFLTMYTYSDSVMARHVKTKNWWLYMAKGRANLFCCRN